MVTHLHWYKEGGIVSEKPSCPLQAIAARLATRQLAFSVDTQLRQRVLRIFVFAAAESLTQHPWMVILKLSSLAHLRRNTL